MKSLTSGVAVITYNGLKYLPQQLDSILAQTRRVDHIVVSDDRSTDGTWEYLEAWAQRTTVPVTLIRNECQLGLIRNFEQAVGAVKADIVFSCDQDDVWFPDKVERLSGIFERETGVVLVHTDAVLVDATGADMHKTLFGELDLTAAERAAIDAGEAFRVYCRRNVVTGATAAFLSSLAQRAHPFPPMLYHDAWLAMLAAATGKIRMLDVPTIYYRQHGANLVGARKLDFLTLLRQFWWALNRPLPLTKLIDNVIEMRAEVHSRLAALADTAPYCMALASEALRFARARNSLPRNPVTRMVAVLKGARLYRRFSYVPWEDLFRDIVRR